jgi:hypothetical protein
VGDQGLAKLSLRGVANHAGVSYGLAHRHFAAEDAVSSDPFPQQRGQLGHVPHLI